MSSASFIRVSAKSNALWLAALCLASVLANPRSADACNPMVCGPFGSGGAGPTFIYTGGQAGVSMPPAAPPPVPSFITQGDVPANGALLVHWMGFSGAGAVSITVKDGAGNTISGTTVAIGGGYFAWRPNAPLVPGSYQATAISDLDTTAETTVTAIAAWVPTMPPIESTGELAVVEGSSTYLCCRETFGGPSIDPCTPTSEVVYFRWSPRLTSTSPPSLLNQFVYQLTSGTPNEAAWTVWPPRATMDFREAAPDYCATLYVLDIAAGRQFEEEICAPNQPERQPGGYPLDYAEALGVDACPVPFDTYLEEWCAANQETCAEPDTNDACFAYGPFCLGWPMPDEDPPPSTTAADAAAEPPSGTGGSGGSAVANDARADPRVEATNPSAQSAPDSGAHGEGDGAVPGPLPSGELGSRACGCRFVGSREGSTLPVVLFALGTALLHNRRRCSKKSLTSGNFVPLSEGRAPVLTMECPNRSLIAVAGDSAGGTYRPSWANERVATQSNPL